MPSDVCVPCGMQAPHLATELHLAARLLALDSRLLVPAENVPRGAVFCSAPDCVTFAVKVFQALQHMGTIERRFHR